MDGGGEEHDEPPTAISAARPDLLGDLLDEHHRDHRLPRARAPADYRSPRSDQIYADLEKTLEASKGSVLRVVDQMRQTGAAAAVLWKSLSSVMSSANQEVRSGFELRMAALLADIAAANSARRAAIVGAGGGAVVDWLLESVAAARGNGAELRGTQAEAARALAYLIADPEVCPAVLGRPHAVPNLLRFIFSFQPKKPKKRLWQMQIEPLSWNLQCPRPIYSKVSTWRNPMNAATPPTHKKSRSS